MKLRTSSAIRSSGRENWSVRSPSIRFQELKPEDSLTKALEEMSRGLGEEAVEEVYIVDHEDQLRGVVTKRDLVNEAQKSHPQVPLNWTRLLESSQWLPQKTQ